MSKNPIGIRLLSFSKENFLTALQNEENPDKRSISTKSHFDFFIGYLSNSNPKGLGVKTILIEEKYVSQSYLDDYALYYVRCFHDYSRFCKRLHFFSTEFDLTRFDIALFNENEPEARKIWDAYCGYIVVKPLPGTIIGETVLKTYDDIDNSKGKNEFRYYPVTKTYKLNLVGKPLQVQTLAFQEQDGNVSACASTALWCAFQKTSELFQTTLPAPALITQSAENLFDQTGRSFPNEGLDHFQIGKAIESVGLTFELRNKQESLKDLNYVKAFTYAYLRLGLPVLLGIHLEGNGAHLITICGYKVPEIWSDNSDMQAGRSSAKGAFPYFASGFYRFYAHDDQVGPFSRLTFTDAGKLLTSWSRATNDEESDSEENIPAEVLSLFVPLHPDIRISFDNILVIAKFLNLIIQLIIEDSDEHMDMKIVWDIFLDDSNNYKNSARELGSKHNGLLYDTQRRIVESALPKYIWIIQALTKDQEILFDIIFDASDILTGDFWIQAHFFNPKIRDILRPGLEGIYEVLLRDISHISKFGIKPSFLTFLISEISQ